MLESMEEIPGFEVNWEPLEVDISEGGDMGYLIENLYFASNDSLGNQMKSFHKVVTTWKKQADGTWKNIVDFGSVDTSLNSLK